MGFIERRFGYGAWNAGHMVLGWGTAYWALCIGHWAQGSWKQDIGNRPLGTGQCRMAFFGMLGALGIKRGNSDYARTGIAWVSWGCLAYA